MENAFDIMDILNGRTKEAVQVDKFEEITLDYRKIKVTEHNKYSMNEIEELAAGIEMAGGLQQPPVLGRVDGEYRLVSGHRRLAAIEMLVNEGEEEYAKVTCRYRDMTETDFKIQLLIGNTFNRKMTDYDRMMQAAEWKEVLQQAKKDGTFQPEKGRRTREYVAKILGVSPATIGELERINNNATVDVKTQLKEGKLNMTAAAETSRLPEAEQNAIAAAAAAGEDVKSEEIKQMAEKKKREEKKEEEEHSKETMEQMKETVSDTDTTEEEKENARRLHILKMLEKYYIYMNEEDLRFLEAMLEDCKRRKREYALEDCGVTSCE